MGGSSLTRTPLFEPVPTVRADHGSGPRTWNSDDGG